MFDHFIYTNHNFVIRWTISAIRNLNRPDRFRGGKIRKLYLGAPWGQSSPIMGVMKAGNAIQWGCFTPLHGCSGSSSQPPDMGPSVLVSFRECSVKLSKIGWDLSLSLTSSSFASPAIHSANAAQLTEHMLDGIPIHPPHSFILISHATSSPEVMPIHPHHSCLLIFLIHANPPSSFMPIHPHHSC
jgi:hypothetical protein